MSKKNHKADRRIALLEKEIGKLVDERTKLQANVAALSAKLSRSDFDLFQTRIEAGVGRAVIAVIMNNTGQRRAFFSKRSLDKAREFATVTVNVAKEVIGADERDALIAGELKYQEQVKRSASSLILPDGVPGVAELYTPEARAEAEGWVDKGVIVQIAPKPLTERSGSVHQEDPRPTPSPTNPFTPFELDR